jgi:hypothetical protein
VATGTKNAKSEASKYTIGAYCEYNGHGGITTKWDKLDIALEGKEEMI